MIKRLIPLLLLSALAYGQNSRYDSYAFGAIALPQGPTIIALTNATITVFSCTPNTSSCVSAASLCASITDAVCGLGNSVASDSAGNFHFYALPGRYRYTVSGVGFTTYTVTDVILPASLIDNIRIPSSPSFTGTVTFSNQIVLPVTTSLTPLAANNPTSLVGVTSQKAETGTADANVLTFTPPAVAGSYRVCYDASVASATAGVIGFTLSWTDSSANAQANIALSLTQMGTAAPALTFTTSAAGDYGSCQTIDVNNAAVAIVVKWVGGGVSAAKASVTIERII